MLRYHMWDSSTELFYILFLEDKKMKQLNEMSYFELLDLEAWCDEKINLLGDAATYYKLLKDRAANQRNEITIHRCLEQFWANKGE